MKSPWLWCAGPPKHLFLFVWDPTWSWNSFVRRRPQLLSGRAIGTHVTPGFCVGMVMCTAKSPYNVQYKRMKRFSSLLQQNQSNSPWLYFLTGLSLLTPLSNLVLKIKVPKVLINFSNVILVIILFLGMFLIDARGFYMIILGYNICLYCLFGFNKKWYHAHFFSCSNTLLKKNYQKLCGSRTSSFAEDSLTESGHGAQYMRGGMHPSVTLQNYFRWSWLLTVWRLVRCQTFAIVNYV